MKENEKANKKVTNIMKIKQNVKGITLIALVVTIVILLILATVTINLVVGQNGLFGRAKNAANVYKIAEDNESQSLSEIADEMDKQMGIIKPVDTSKLDEAATGTIADKQTKHTDGSQVAVIPAGFCVVGGTIPTGLVISDVAGDDLANSKGGNQYVWIPCTIDGANGSIKYDRYAFTRTGWSNNQTKSAEGVITEGSYTGKFTESMDTVEQTSITQYGGFYIGRYEAGDGVLTTAKALRTSTTSKANAVTVKKSQAPYNFATRDEAKALAEGIKSANNYTGIMASKLCSSYAYDTALTFVDTVKNGYSTNTTTNITDNCSDTTFTYTDITGASKTKAASSYALVPTGVTTPVANIYDLGGNVEEWTTEVSSASNLPCVYRGGDYVTTSLNDPACSRNYNGTTYSNDLFGFRPTLYL